MDSSMNVSSDLRSLPESAIFDSMPLLPSNTSITANPPLSSSLTQSTTRKRMRTEQWDGSTSMMPELGMVDVAAAPVPFIPSAAAPSVPFSAESSSISGANIQTCLEDIQASLKSLNEMQFAGVSGSATHHSFPSAAAVSVPDLSAAAAAVATPHTMNDYTQDVHFGSDPDSTSARGFVSSHQLPARHPSPDTFRKSKQRVFEKQRRDELKKHMELLSSLIHFSTPTNKIGVVTAAIAYVREQRVRLDAERNRVKDLEAEVAELRHCQVQPPATPASTFDDSHSTALSPLDSPTLLIAKYQTLLQQFREMQHSYSSQQLANVLKSSHPTTTAAGTGFPRLMDNKDDINPPPAIPTNLNHESSLPNSPSDFNSAFFHPHAEFQDRSPLSRPLASIGLNATSFDLPAAHNTLELPRLPGSSDNPFTSSLMFNSETTARLLCCEGIIVEISAKMLRDLGFERHELIGKPVSFITPSIKQPMSPLVRKVDHEAEPLALLDSFKTKQGGIIFRYGLFETIWDVAKCAGKSAISTTSTGTQEPPLAYSCNGSGIEDPQPNTVETMSMNPGFGTSHDNNEGYFHPCEVCGQRPRFGMFTGSPTHFSEIDEITTLTVKNIVRLFDPQIRTDGIQIDEFFTRGKVTYDATQTNQAGMTRTIKVTKFLPMPFIQGQRTSLVQIRCEHVNFSFCRI